MVAWSRIQETELAAEACWRIADNGCAYHNLIHVDEMYQYLEDTSVPYDEALDWAVLFHDIVYDKHPEKESRSALLFYEMQEEYLGFAGEKYDLLRVGNLINCTADHKIYYWSTPSQKAIVRADLHALTDKIRTVENFVKIMMESMELYGCTVEQFAESNILFMNTLKETMLLNILVDSEHEMFYDSVIKGIWLSALILKP